jgi:tetratricopeptide (TPR) repeat protein
MGLSGRSGKRDLPFLFAGSGQRRKEGNAMRLERSMIQTTAVTAVAAGVLGWSAWRYGLFFEADVYPVELVLLGAGALLALLAVLRLPGRWELRQPAVPPIVLLPLVITACYGVVYLIGPASAKGTVDSILRWTTYSCWLALLLAWWKKPEHRAWGEAAVQAVGMFMLAGGWLGWFGVLPFPDIVLRFHDPELSATGARLAGYLQYPNAYGAVLAFFLVRQWQLWAGTAKWGAIWASLTAVPYAGALLLTESRGSWVAVIAGLALAWWFARDRRVRSRLLWAAGITAAGAALASAAAWRTGTSTGGGWLSVITIVAGALVMYPVWLWLSRNTESKSEKLARFSGIAVLLSGALALVCSVVASTAGERISGNYGTAVSRLLFYRDGWQMFTDAVWIGQGGKSWRTLFGLYQSQPYVGGEVHSGYLDMLLEIGLIGFALFAAMMGIFIWRLWKTNRPALAPAAVLLMHAAVDFDLSYGWMWLLLIAWFALFTAGGEERAFGGAADAARWGAAGGRVTAALLLGASVCSGWAAWHSLAAVRAAAAADAAAAPAAREAELLAALEANPAWGRIRLALAPLLPEAGERESVLAAGLRYEPQSGPLLLQLGLAEAELGHVAQAEKRLREALRLQRYSRDSQTAAIAAMAQLADSLDFAGRPEEARKAAQAAASFYERYRLLVREVTTMERPANGKRFGMTSPALYHAAQAYHTLGRDERARQLLKLLLSGTDEDWRTQAGELLEKMTSQTK